MLTMSQQAMLVCHQISILPAKQDLLSGTVAAGCCPTCCPACNLVWQLYDAEQLDTVVRQAPEQFWRDAFWWHSGRVDHEHLLTAWFWNRCPDHESH